jgi:stearoyl-CoA desaturase (delta-9 desaturase)
LIPLVPIGEPSILAPTIEERPKVSRPAQLATAIAVVLPFAGLVTAISLVWGWGLTWVDVGLLVGLYLLTGLGITVGFHRLLTHRSFDTYSPVKFVLAVLGSMAVQGGVLKWAANHRRHHQHSDTPDDPHSPHRFGKGVLSRLRGFWHSHVGWAFTPDPVGLTRYVRDLSRSRTLLAADRLFVGWVLLGLLLPAVLGGLLTESWIGAVRGLLWGGLVRIFLVHHITWSVNSIGHLWGSRPHQSGDESRDNFVLGILALGEGWHNSHHAHPTSARHGLRWWQPDISYFVIRLLAVLGLAWNIRLPAKAKDVTSE